LTAVSLKPRRLRGDAKPAGLPDRFIPTLTTAFVRAVSIWHDGRTVSGYRFARLRITPEGALSSRIINDNGHGGLLTFAGSRKKARPSSGKRSSYSDNSASAENLQGNRFTH
jgi:hypothetical protein